MLHILAFVAIGVSIGMLLGAPIGYSAGRKDATWNLEQRLREEHRRVRRS